MSARPDREILHVEMPPKLKRKLEKMARDQRRTVSEVVRMWLENAK